MTTAAIIGFFKSKSMPFVIIIILASLLSYSNHRKKIYRTKYKDATEVIKKAEKEKKRLGWELIHARDSLSALIIAKTISDTTIINYQDSTIYQFRDSLNVLDTVIYDSVSGGTFLLTYKPVTINSGVFSYKLPISLIKERSIIWETPHWYLTAGLVYNPKYDLSNYGFNFGVQYINRKYGVGAEYMRIGKSGFYQAKFIYRIG